ncbi:MAG: glycosyltransferase family 2 protein [Acidobacteriota bacterium]|nr:glycosyltransferase family 2 protein [Acidobacteriota bacterium]
MKDVSIIIVNWNTREFLDACLGSLRASSAALDLEILVVDNASSDGSQEMVRVKYPEVVLIENRENLGFAKANNIGLRQATGRYLALINSDVTAPAGCLPSIVEYMDRASEVGMLGPKMLTPSGAWGPSSMRRPTLAIWAVHAFGLAGVLPAYSLHMEKFDHERTQPVDVLNGWFWVVRGEAYRQVGGLDERFFMYGEDIDWCHRYADAGWEVVYFAGAEATHYGGGSSKRAPVRFYVEMQRANLQYWQLHHGRLSQVAYLALVALHQSFRAAGYSLQYLLRPAGREESGFKVARSVACLRWLAGGVNPAVKSRAQGSAKHA